MIYDATKKHLYNIEREKIQKMSQKERPIHKKTYVRIYKKS